MHIFNLFYLLHSYNPTFLICMCFNMVSFRDQKKTWATLRSVSFRGLIQNFWWASPPLSYAESPRRLGVLSSSQLMLQGFKRIGYRGTNSFFSSHCPKCLFLSRSLSLLVLGSGQSASQQAMRAMGKNRVLWNCKCMKNIFCLVPGFCWWNICRITQYWSTFTD